MFLFLFLYIYIFFLFFFISCFFLFFLSSYIKNAGYQHNGYQCCYQQMLDESPMKLRFQLWVTCMLGCRLQMSDFMLGCRLEHDGYQRWLPTRWLPMLLPTDAGRITNLYTTTQFQLDYFFSLYWLPKILRLQNINM